ncbi:MAG: tRNA 4-thiouridine(8) synthase ThiI [Candidatus Omnitrophota bacterium]
MRALALISGGLDSILAARLIKGQGIDVIPLNFKIPFCHQNKKGGINLGRVVEGCGRSLERVDIGQEFLGLLKKPRYGFGSNMNPCLDCKILMLKKAKEMMPGFAAAFVVTGEVLGQRPMSQHRKALDIIANGSGLGGLLVRPLSARLLDETIPEKEGWLVRDRLLDFNGRSRSRQLTLAGTLGVKEYSAVAGGCLLTDRGFSQRVKDLIRHQELCLDNIELLKTGRHFRIGQEAKLAVGRNQEENIRLEGIAGGDDYLFWPQDIAGPTALGRGVFSKELIEASCRIVCRYCDLNAEQETRINYRCVHNQKENMAVVSPFKEEEILSLRI